MTQEIWTFRPTDLIKSLVKKEINRRVGCQASKANRRGLKTKIILEALLKHLFAHLGKREA